LRWLLLVSTLFGAIAFRPLPTRGQEPDQKPDQKPKPAQDAATTVPVGYARLGEAEVAKRLKLTDAQRKEVARLLDQRAHALAGVPQPQQAHVIEESDRKLAAVLTDEQATLWQAEQQAAQERRLRFNFRFQQWKDVLEWLAEQADLSLVLDAPPPGTFNYTDNRQYTPFEAIDLVNGVLLTKGYSLIRRGRMLLLINLSEEIPPGVIPRVSPQELEKRGQFELVSVLFPIDNRVAADVAKEISPLLGPHGKAVPLPKTKQILVTDTAGTMRAIHAVIESIPQTEPAKSTPAAKPEKPKLVVYPIKSADPQAVLGVLKALISGDGATFVRDPKLDQISAYATPTQQKAVKRVIDQMEVDNPPDKRPRLQTYAVDEDQAPQLIETLQKLVPAARLSFDPSHGHLVAWATPKEQTQIEQTLKQLGEDVAGDNRPRLEVYPLFEAESATMVTALKNLVPRARLEFDADSLHLIVVATPSDQAKIKRAIDQLRAGPSVENVQRLEVYPLTHRATADLPTLMRQLVPKAKLTLSQDGQQLTAVASARDQQTIRTTLDRMEQAQGKQPKRRLEIYNVTAVEQKRFQAIVHSLTAQLPGIRVIADAKPGELAVWADPSEHAIISQLLATLERHVPPDEQFTLATYSTGTVNPTKVLDLVKRRFPEPVHFELDTPNRRLLVWASPADQPKIEEAIKAILAQLVPPDEQFTLVAYSTGTIDPTKVLALIKGRFPEPVHFELDTPNRRLLVRASPDDQPKIDEAIKALVAQLVPPDQQFTLVGYSTGTADPAKVLALIKQRFPEPVHVELDTPNRRLLVRASPDDQPKIDVAIKAILAQLVPSDEQFTLVAYSTGTADPAKVLALIKRRFPEPVHFELDTLNRRLLVWAGPDDQPKIDAAIKAILAQLVPPDEQFTLAAYSTRTADPTKVLGLIKRRFPEPVHFELDTANRRLLVSASPADQPKIEAAINAILAQLLPADAQFTMAAYSTRTADPTKVLGLIKRRFPEPVRFELDAANHRLLVWADPDEQSKIEEALNTIVAQLVPDQPDPFAPVLEIYWLEQPVSAEISSLLSSLVPKARVTPSSDHKQLLVVATPKEHEKIASVLKRFDQARRNQPKRRLELYPVTAAERKRLQTVLKGLASQLPGVEIVADSEPGEIAIWATREQHATVADILDKLKQDVPPQAQYHLASYPIRVADPTKVMQVLQRLFPEPVRIEIDKKSRRVIVWARASDQEAIKKAVETIDSGDPAETRLQLMVYPVHQADPSLLITLLQELLPDAKLQIDSRARTIVARARRADQALVKAVIEKIDRDSSTAGHRVLAVYPLDQVDAQSVLAMLRPSLIHEADLSVDRQRNTLMVWADPERQGAIATALKRLKEQLPGEQERVSRVYLFHRADPDAVRSLIDTMFQGVAKVQISVDRRNNKLMVSATPAQHKTIAQLAAEADRLPVGDRVPAVYAMGKTDPKAVLNLIDPQLKQDAQFLINDEAKSLIVWAAPTTQAAIGRAIEQLKKQLPAKQERTARIYRFHNTDATTALTIVRALVPGVPMTVNGKDGSLVVTALPEEHRKIAQMIRSLEGEQAARQRVVVEAHQVSRASLPAVQAMIQRLFAGQPQFQITSDPANGKLIATALPEQQETIRRLIAEADKAAGTDRVLAIYPLGRTDGQALIGMIDPSLKRYAQITFNPERKSLLVWANRDRQQAIAETVERLKKDLPDLPLRRPHVYRLRTADPRTIQAVVASLVPRATSAVDLKDGSLIVSALPEEHERIAEAIEQMDAERPADQRIVLEAHRIRSANPSAVLTMVNNLFAGQPHFQATLDAANSKLVVVALPDQQATIRRLIADAEKASGTDRVLSVYPLGRADGQALLAMIDPTIKQGAQLTFNRERKSLLVWAAADKQEAIRKAVEQLKQQVPEIPFRRPHVYRLRTADPRTIQAVVASLVPGTTSAVDLKDGSLIVSALPEEHERIAETIAQMDSERPADQRIVLETHRIRSVNPSAVLTMVQNLFAGQPHFQATLDAANSKLVVVALPDQQATIRRLIADAEKASGTDRVLSVYPLGRADGQALLAMIDPTIKQDAQLTFNRERKSLLVWAAADKQEAIRKAVEQLKQQVPEIPLRRPHVYQLRTADPRDIQRVVASLAPQATSAVDLKNGSLIVSALPEEHRRIAEAIEQVDAERPADQQIVLEAHPVTSADLSSVLSMVQGLFSGQPRFQVTQDTKNHKLLVAASPAQHEVIRKFIQGLEKTAATKSKLVLEVYPLHNAAPTSVTRVIESLMEKETDRPDISVDPATRQLIAIATPAQQLTIRSAIERLQQEARELEVFHLEVVDPTAAQLAIENMFGGNQRQNPSAPYVDADYTSQQLFVRADEQQLAEIRKLLTKMGEPGIGGTATGTGRRVRVIRFEGDVRAAVREIERIWPRLRKNKLHVVTPSAVIPGLRLPIAPPQRPHGATTPEKPADGDGASHRRLPVRAAVWHGARGTPVWRVAQRLAPSKTKRPTTDRPAEIRADGAPAAKPATKSKGHLPPAPTTTEPPSGGAAPDRSDLPVVVAPGRDRVTIASDDPDALNQLEQLFRALSRRGGLTDSNFEIFRLENADADVVSVTLQQLFRDKPIDRSYSSGTVTVVPDRRTNSVLVRANRADRALIEELLNVLDASDLPESLTPDSPAVIPVRNTSADSIAQVLEDVYKTQLTEASRRNKPLPIPRGVSRQLASVLEQLNAAQSGPLMTLGVDVATNSLVVVASRPLVEEVRQLVEQLDSAAGERPARSIKIMPLKKTNVAGVEAALRRVLRPSRNGRSRRRSRR